MQVASVQVSKCASELGEETSCTCTPAICHLPLATCHLPLATCHLPLARLFFFRHGEVEGCALAFHTLNPDSPAVCFDDMFRNRQPKARATLPACTAHFIEPLEDARQVAF